MSVLALFLKRFIVHIFSSVAILLTLINFGLFRNLFNQAHDESVLAERRMFMCVLIFTIFIDIMFFLCFREIRTAYLEKTKFISEITQKRNLEYSRVAGDEKSGGVAGSILDSKAGFDEYHSHASNAYKNDSGYAGNIDYANADEESFDIKEYGISNCVYGFIAVILICSGVIISGPIGLIFIAAAVGIVIFIGVRDWDVACSYSYVYEKYTRLAREIVIRKQYEIAEEYRKRGINASKIGLRCNNCGNKVFSINGREVVCSYCNNAIKINTL
ncbi:hypothetical protein [Gardnerella vaginalis]|uniref:hypothetical protein n=1 Tax=Gardnerella vaginalis TaxID=2702 RepID=UPI0039EFE357